MHDQVTMSARPTDAYGPKLFVESTMIASEDLPSSSEDDNNGDDFANGASDDVGSSQSRDANRRRRIRSNHSHTPSDKTSHPGSGKRKRSRGRPQWSDESSDDASSESGSDVPRGRKHNKSK